MPYLSMSTACLLCMVCLVGFMVVPSQLGAWQGSAELWRHAMSDGYVMTLFRDEVVQVHHAYELIFKG